ncbi:MAG: hypothetical protein ACKO2P_08085 [Planctomycetota bacterium]
MSERFLQWFMPTAGLLLLLRTLQLRRLLLDWTIELSHRWSAISAGFLVAADLAASGILTVGPGWRGMLQYLAAILLLAPAICTLGARRPGAGPWQWFVVLPMILVLVWPVFAQATGTAGRSLVQLSNPQLCGFGLAALMGLGPGLGTAATGAVLLRFSATVLALLPLRSSGVLAELAARLVPLVLLLESWIQGHLITGHLQRLQQAGTTEQRAREVWLMFRTLYGSIWPRRVQDRMLQFEQGERWTVTLTDGGFLRPDGQPVCEDDLSRPLESFRWLMGRFVTAAWLQQHLSEGGAGNSGPTVG